MHSRVNQSKYSTDKRQLVVNGVPQLEYDGLHTGELAWILGRRLKGGGTEMSAPERFAHQAMGGMGNGVDRMQRLASTAWMEALFREKLGNVEIKLHEISLTNKFAMDTDASLFQFSKYLHGANALQVPDVTWWRAILEGDKAYDAVGHKAEPAGNNSGKRLQGIDVVTTGPFLRGIQTDSSVVRFNNDHVMNSTSPEDMPRNIGDSLAFAALEAELRKNNFMDWTPDGIVLSKLESPTDEPMKSTELDARQAQLFNVGIQGPSITTSWTSDLRDHRLEVQPLDKVFVCVVATLSYAVSGTAGKTEYDLQRKAQAVVLKKMQDYHEAAKKKEEALMNTIRGELEQAMKDADEAAENYKAAVSANKPKYQKVLAKLNTAKSEYENALKVKAADVDTKKSTLEQVQQEMDALWEPPNDKEAEKITERSLAIRTNRRPVDQAILSNFRLMRTTSSHMSNYSYYKPGDDNSRLGLRLGKLDGTPNAYSGVADVIVGGWCIGTVVDSAASRSTVGFQTVKTHPTSMAINLNVNVQWWSGDKLYKHYMDVGGQVLRRGQKRTLSDTVPDSKGGTKINPVIQEDRDAVPDPNDPRQVGTRDAPVIQTFYEEEGLDENSLIPLEEARDVRQRVSQSNFASSSAFAAAPRARGVSRRA